MKSEDFERLKAVCEKEGFEIKAFTVNPESFIIDKKDEWEGVEFAEATTTGKLITTGKVYNIIKNKYDSLTFFAETKKIVENVTISCFKPSTEQAYIDQLKAKAFELYGDIKEGDRFDCSEMGYSKNASILLSKWLGLYYSKKFDSLELCGFTLYKQGKWAKKIEKVRVEWKDTSRNYISFSYNNSGTNLVHRGPELAEVLEKYLNK